MKDRLNRIISILRIFGILLGVGIIIYQIFTSIREFNWSIINSDILINILSALACITIAMVFQMVAWKIIIETFNYDISIENIFSGFSLSFVARLIPGTIWGYLTRGEWMNREHGVPYSITNLGSIVETVGYLIANFLVIVQGLILVKLNTFTVIFFLIFIIGTWASLNIFVLTKPARRFLLLDKNQIFLFPFVKWILIFSIFISMWYCFGLGLFFFTKTINIQITYTYILEISAIYSTAWLIGFVVPFIPSGLGLREYSLAILLEAQFSLIKADASFIAIGYRILVSIGELFWIVYGLTKKTIGSMNRKIIP